MRKEVARAGKVVGGLGRRDVVNEKTGDPPPAPLEAKQDLGLRAMSGKLGEESSRPGDRKSKLGTYIIRTTLAGVFRINRPPPLQIYE